MIAMGIKTSFMVVEFVCVCGVRHGWVGEMLQVLKKIFDRNERSR